MEGVERLFPQFLSQLALDGSDRVSLGLEILVPVTVRVTAFSLRLVGESATDT